MCGDKHFLKITGFRAVAIQHFRLPCVWKTNRFLMLSFNSGGSVVAQLLSGCKPVRSEIIIGCQVKLVIVSWCTTMFYSSLSNPACFLVLFHISQVRNDHCGIGIRWIRPRSFANAGKECAAQCGGRPHPTQHQSFRLTWPKVCFKIIFLSLIKAFKSQ